MADPLASAIDQAVGFAINEFNGEIIEFIQGSDNAKITVNSDELMDFMNALSENQIDGAIVHATSDTVYETDQGEYAIVYLHAIFFDDDSIYDGIELDDCD
jgi:hypothetical protein